MDSLEQLTEYEKLKKEGLRNTIRSKQFPFEPSEFKYPAPAHKVDNPLYATSNLDYGKLMPSNYELHERWYPRNNKFTGELSGTNYKNNSLRTEVNRNPVNDILDGFN